MTNFEYCAYTYRHRRAIEYLINKLIKDQNLRDVMMNRALAHDIDKLMAYQFYDKSSVSNLHSCHIAHHMTNPNPKSYFDKLEAILDYESAGYTKPDKPLNAFDTIHMLKNKGKLDDNITNDLFAICHEFGLDTSYFVMADIEGMEYLKQFDVVTEDMIYQDIMNYWKSLMH